MTIEQELDALLGEVRACHDPTAADQKRVQEALSDAVLRQQLAKSCESEIGGRRGHLRLLMGSGGPTLVGVMALAAAAAGAVVTLAHPGSELGRRLMGGAGELKLEPEASVPARTNSEKAEPGKGRQSGSGEAWAKPEAAGGCSVWPCLEQEPRRALTLGGAALREPAAPEPEGPSGAMMQEREQSPAAVPEHEARPRLEVAPALALDVAPGRATPGVGLRVAVPVTQERDVAIEGTLERFSADGAAALLVGGLGVCWRPVQGQLEASLCGRVGYETGSANERAARDVADSGGADPWRVTAGASAEMVWNLTRELGAYVAVQGAMPIATSAGAGRALGMRVMAGPQVNF